MDLINRNNRFIIIIIELYHLILQISSYLILDYDAFQKIVDLLYLQVMGTGLITPDCSQGFRHTIIKMAFFQLVIYALFEEICL